MFDRLVRMPATPSLRMLFGKALAIDGIVGLLVDPVKRQSVPFRSDQVWRPQRADPVPPHRNPTGENWGRALQMMWRRYRSRQRIAMLDTHDLRDIGVSYAEAEAEANKPFWKH